MIVFLKEISFFTYFGNVSEQVTQYKWLNLRSNIIVVKIWKSNLQQATSDQGHFLEGTQRLEEPVSKTTLNGCPGVPIVMSP